MPQTVSDPTRAASEPSGTDPVAPGPLAVGCRFCGATLRHTLVDLGAQPLCESFLTADQLDDMEPFYPLHVRVCEACLLVQLPAVVAREEIFREYAYFSSYSASWLDHARRYADEMVDRNGLGPEHLVVELASNDGYLLRHFVARGVPVLGIDPARNVAAVAEAAGVPTIAEFFGRDLATQLVAEGRSADLIAANNVLAQVPDLNDFVAGIAILLRPTGLATIEFPHVVRLIEEVQFDTIYHEHFSYFSLTTTSRIADAHGLVVVDVEELPTHGGSLRVHLRRADAPGLEIGPAVGSLMDREVAGGYDRIEGYGGFEPRVQAVKRRLLSYLIEAREQDLRVAGYGAPGKGNTLLNYCGIRTDLLEYTVDRNPYKHGRFTPGTRIPILDPSAIDERRPDRILILPWNLKDEIARQLAPARAWGARLVAPIPTVAEVAWPSEDR